MSDLPEPLTPADCDLRGYRWMPLDVVRVIDSDTFGISTGDEFKTAFRLWAKCWLQVPAASLPDDDRLLAHLAGLSENMPKWEQMRAVALRGFVKCSDGRLYHPVIAEKALEAMGRREEHAEREENQQTRQQRLRERRKAMFEQLRMHDIVPAWDTKTAELERLIATLPVTHRGRTGDAPVTPERNSSDAPVTDQRRTGDEPVTSSNPYGMGVSGEPVTHRGRTGDTCDEPATAIEKDTTGQDSKPKTKEAPVVDTPPAPDETPDPPVEIVPNSRGAAISLLMRRNGVEGCNASNPIVIEWSANPKVTDDLLLTAADMAKKREVLRPGPNYLDPIVKQLLNPKPAKPKQDDWHRTPEGVLRKSREIGFGDGRRGETTEALKARIFDELARREREGAAA